MARKGEAQLAQIVKDFGLSVTTLKRWMAIAERKDSGAGPAAAESAEMQELKKRNRLLEPAGCWDSASKVPTGGESARSRNVTGRIRIW